MKLTCRRSCTSLGVDVDGRDVESLSLVEMKEMIGKIVDSIGDKRDDLRGLVIDLIETNGEWESYDACGCCGDVDETFTLEL